jgi:ribosomal protein S18 acetylase RimI-like enzyme
MNLLIRPAIPADAPILAAAEREIAKIPGHLASRPEELKDESFREKIEALAKNDSAAYVVLEDNGVIVGHSIAEPHRLANLAHVVFLTIAIHEGHQGQGLGRILMEHLVSWARAHEKIGKFELQVRSSNVRAIRLYESLGFVEEGRKTRRIKYGPDDYRDDVYMGLWVGLEGK